MRWNILGLGLALSSLLGSGAAYAEAPKRRPMIGVCAHPHGPSITRWSYSVDEHSRVLTGGELERALALHDDLPIFYYDPNASVEDLQRSVPLVYTNRPRKCEPKPPPPPKKPPPPPPPKEKDEVPPTKDGNGNGSGKTGNGNGGGGNGNAPPAEKTGGGRPPGVKDFVGEKPLSEEERFALRKQKEREACARDEENCPKKVLKEETLLPREGVLKKESLLPTYEEMRAQPDPPQSMERPPETLTDDGGILPLLSRGEGRREMVSAVPCKQMKEGCTDGDGKTPKKEKDRFEKFAEELAFAAAIATTQMNEETNRPDGKDFGIVGGRNADGPNNPVIQAVVSALQLSAAAASEIAAFQKKLAQAIRAKKSLVITNPAELSDEAIDGLVQIHGAEELAAALNQLKVIAPYSLWKKFTAKLGGRWQAHHILEKAKIRDLRIKLDPDLSPSAILSEAEHKAVTAKLALHTKTATKLDELWQGYKKAYVDYPEFLDAIKKYFPGVE